MLMNEGLLFCVMSRMRRLCMPVASSAERPSFRMSLEESCRLTNLGKNGPVLFWLSMARTCSLVRSHIFKLRLRKNLVSTFPKIANSLTTKEVD